uniref:Uncharacterized protein n=1 Tax=Glossina palpalis gambiensis TaxID=67801 RepID=A0A1B0AMP5_9MUSC
MRMPAKQAFDLVCGQKQNCYHNDNISRDHIPPIVAKHSGLALQYAVAAIAAIAAIAAVAGVVKVACSPAEHVSKTCD